ncbi:MAG: hypothetical protein QQW96_16795 [Tychonema bourrellyi B0820]|uniref:Uncharacterized protein n=1 Tax=Tychonema bourrellyi FEM_GT703 TaxID=2040638 RepID=A0A2G4EX11_9CYAN|nr:hypothetical protein [Tychonema bourrellyi]MDQ2099289.1 hypothetical protein [Tychonema bourrellyi B0820]PHX53980.1 hypothetical protein CP500_018570 [Tychonema bourrellyi FEM_GT703]
MTSFNQTETFDTDNEGQVDIVAELADWDDDEVAHVVTAAVDLNSDEIFETVFIRNEENTFDVVYDTNQDGIPDAVDYGSNGSIDIVADLNNDDQINAQDVSIASAAIDALQDV